MYQCIVLKNGIFVQLFRGLKKKSLALAAINSTKMYTDIPTNLIESFVNNNSITIEHQNSIFQKTVDVWHFQIKSEDSSLCT